MKQSELNLNLHFTSFKGIDKIINGTRQGDERLQ